MVQLDFRLVQRAVGCERVVVCFSFAWLGRFFSESHFRFRVSVVGVANSQRLVGVEFSLSRESVRGGVVNVFRSE